MTIAACFFLQVSGEDLVFTLRSAVADGSFPTYEVKIKNSETRVFTGKEKIDWSLYCDTK